MAVWHGARAALPCINEEREPIRTKQPKNVWLSASKQSKSNMKTNSFPSLNYILKNWESYFFFEGKMYTKNDRGEVVEFPIPSEAEPIDDRIPKRRKSK